MNIECLICLEKLDSEDLSALQCGHIYHDGCIRNWINEKKDCPKCRQKVGSKSVIKLYVDTAVADGSQRRSVVSELRAQVSELSGLLENRSKAVAELRIENERIQLDASARVAADNLTIHELRHSVEELTEKIGFYESIRMLVCENERGWKRELRKYELHENDGVRGLAVALAETKAEVKLSNAAYKSLSKKSETKANQMSRKNAKLTQQLTAKHDEAKLLRKEVTGLRKKSQQVDQLRARLAESERRRKELERSVPSAPPRRPRPPPARAKSSVPEVFLLSDDDGGESGRRVFPEQKTRGVRCPTRGTGEADYNDAENPVPVGDGGGPAKKPRGGRATAVRERVLSPLDNIEAVGHQ